MSLTSILTNIANQKLRDKFKTEFIHPRFKFSTELKAKPMTTREDFRQVLRYLEALKIPLILLVNFRSSKLFIKRIINARCQHPRNPS